jgi:hypothetical protein
MDVLPPQDYLSPAAKETVKPGMTPCQQAQALNQKELSSDAVKSMAHGLPERDSVKWAAASAEKVSNPAHQPDLEAIRAAKAWTQNPTPEAQKAAALAASKTDFQTPGPWAAQGAAWAGSGTGLTAHAVTGAVLLAAAQGGKPNRLCATSWSGVPWILWGKVTRFGSPQQDIGLGGLVPGSLGQPWYKGGHLGCSR